MLKNIVEKVPMYLEYFCIEKLSLFWNDTLTLKQDKITQKFHKENSPISEMSIKTFTR